jgi:hypothetical protein
MCKGKYSTTGQNFTQTGTNEVTRCGVSSPSRRKQGHRLPPRGRAGLYHDSTSPCSEAGSPNVAVSIAHSLLTASTAGKGTASRIPFIPPPPLALRASRTRFTRTRRQGTVSPRRWPALRGGNGYYTAQSCAPQVSILFYFVKSARDEKCSRRAARAARLETRLGHVADRLVPRARPNNICRLPRLHGKGRCSRCRTPVQ